MVVAPAPTFSLYRLLTAVSGGRYLPVPLGRRFRSTTWTRSSSRRSRERARVVVLNSPNNPTGSVPCPPGAVERVLAETDALVLCDEAYQDFGGPDGDAALTARPTGWWCCAPSPRRWGWPGCASGWRWRTGGGAAEIAKAKLPYNVNLFTLTAAEVALAHMEVRQDTGGAHRGDARPCPAATARPTGHDGLPERGQLLPGAAARGGPDAGVPSGC